MKHTPTLPNSDTSRPARECECKGLAVEETSCEPPREEEDNRAGEDAEVQGSGQIVSSR